MTCVVLGIQLKEYGSPIESLAEFILATISDITVLVLSVAVEQESFLETACYLYRASVAIMELMTTDYTCQEHAMKIFQSISRSVNLAKLLVEKCQQGIQPFSDPELITITAQLEEIIKHIGECLSFIPPSTFGDQHYAESSVQSLSNEMQTAHFEAQASKTSEIDKKTLSFRKQPKVEPTSTPTETDLYPISFEASTENPSPQLIEMLKSTSWISKRKHEDMSGSLTTMPPVGQYLEPMYETFFCPLTNKVMEDPVTIRSGVTFERKAIIEWFEKFNGSEQTILCPTTGQKLVSTAFNENIALKTTIKQWKERNEAARIKVACEALSLASSDAMVLEAVKEVQSICRRKPYNNTQVHGVGILPLLVQCLGEIALGHDGKTYVAQRVSPTLIKMVHNGNTLARSTAFRTLVQLSSHQPNANILVEAGIVQVMVEEMFIRKIHNEPMNSTSEAAAILANIFESGLELEELQVNSHGHTMTSDYVVHNIVYMLNNTSPDELNNNLIRILLVLAKNPKPEATIVSLVKETEASYTLIEFINNPHDKLSIAAIKLLTVLSPHIGHLLAERLCKTRGQPENLLIEHSTETALITEKQAVSAKFLAKLPHQNLTLNLALLYKNIVPTIIQKINQIQGRRTRSSRFESTYFEGLVGILVRFTTTLYEPQMLFLAKNQNFTTVFTELLMKTSSDEVQRSSAIGLENLSLESISLSKPSQIKRKKFMKLFYLPKYLSFGTSRRRRVPLCPVHRGVCSSQNTFCIVDAKAVEKLLVCLENENPEVVEAALSAISTLLDDKVDVDKSVSMLSEVNAVQHVLNAVKEHKQEGLRQKSFWVLEKFLNKGGDESASYISNDRVLPAILVSAFHHGAGNTKQMAEKILRHLNKMPNLYT